MLRINVLGLTKLIRAVSEDLDVDYHDVFDPFGYYVLQVLIGEMTLDEGIRSVELTRSGRFNFVEVLEDFDLSLNLTPEATYPDYSEVVETDMTYNIEYSLRNLAGVAWHKLQDADYIEGAFCLALLVAIFLSSYNDVYFVDYDPVLPAFQMLREGIVGKKLGDDYEKTRTA